MTPGEPTPEEGMVALAKYDYLEYKRIIFLNKIQKIVGVGSNEPKKNDEVADNEFMKRLDILTKEFIRHVYLLKNTAEKGNKEDYVFLATGIVSKIDDLCNEIHSNELFGECDGLFLPGDVSLTKELTRRKDNIATVASSFLVSSKVAAGVWPPPEAHMEMLQNMIEYVESVKNYITLVKDNVPQLRKLKKDREKSSKKEKWQRECLQNEKIKELFGYWEDSMVYIRFPILLDCY
jgi:hypothetical protein